MSVERLIDRYCTAWSLPDPAARAAALREVWADGATYTDPTAHTTGADALLAHITQVQAAYPGARIERTSAIDAHHGMARFAWEMTLADGSRLPEGLDIARLSADGTRIASITGFFGPLKPRTTFTS
ncbi:MAG: nuclear transport factor 2 family protein [Ottowia sp.]|uniref:nuclear transport factor 2 family protein n=1 Tax=Ottowia sp. TaxID=1898956 RepID=UPI0039E4A34C